MAWGHYTHLLLLKPSALKAHTDFPVKHLAVDVTIPPSPNCYADQPESTPKSLEVAHRDAIKQKLNGARSARTITNQEILRQLLLNHVTYLPFTVDYLGGLGHYAHLLLHGTTPPPPIPLDPTWNTCQSLLTKQLTDQLKATPPRPSPSG